MVHPDSDESTDTGSERIRSMEDANSHGTFTGLVPEAEVHNACWDYASLGKAKEESGSKETSIVLDSRNATHDCAEAQHDTREIYLPRDLLHDQIRRQEHCCNSKIPAQTSKLVHGRSMGQGIYWIPAQRHQIHRSDRCMCRDYLRDGNSPIELSPMEVEAFEEVVLGSLLENSHKTHVGTVQVCEEI